MRQFWPLLIFTVFLTMSWLVIINDKQDTTQKAQKSNRIITLAPNLTEIAFAIGLQDRIVAVTDFCEYPVQTQNLPKVGGFVNPNIEHIVALKPDLVLLFASQQKVIHQLQQLNIPVLTLDNTNLNSIRDNIAKIGERTGQQQQARNLIQTMQKAFDDIRSKVANKPKPKVLLAMGHSLNTDSLGTVYIAGTNDFYNELIEFAGGQNVFTDKRMKLPSLSTEGILSLNPDIILDIFPEPDDHQIDIKQIEHQWNQLTSINAVKNQRVHIIEEDYATIPGPRIVLLLKQMAKLFHPQQFESNS
jgi:iron complex transport system substrate-binding protein